MRTHLRTANLLALLVLVAVALTWLISGRAGATAAFQSPNPFQSELVTPTVEPSASPTGTAYPVSTTISPPAPTLEPTLEPTQEATPQPTLQPTPPTLEATLEPTMSPTPPGFLPPPTLTSPGTPVPAVAASRLPGELPVRVAPTGTPTSTGTSSPTQTNVTATLARLIDQGVLAVGYLWLCCGILALVGVGGALVWSFRRARRG